MNIIPDEINLDAYLKAAEDVRAFVRSASQYAAELDAEFAPRESRQREPFMFSTKLGGTSYRPDDSLEFRRGEVTVWAGYNGHRKSTFTGQVALDMLRQGQRVLIASFEMLPAKTLARMARQALGINRLSQAERERFMAWVENLSIFDHMGEISPERCLAVCRYFAEELRGQHVFIDSLMMVCASEERMDEQKRFMTSLVRLAIETGMHVHLIAHCRKPQGGEDKAPTKYDLRGSAALSDQASNVVMVWMDQLKKASPQKDNTKPDAFVTVEKQRNGAWEGRALLWFDEPSMRFVNAYGDIPEPYVGLEQ